MGRRLLHTKRSNFFNPIRSPILLAAIAAALATIVALVLVARVNSALAASSLVNGNFETGNLTGWTVDTTASGGTARAVTSYWYVDPGCRGDIGCPHLDPIRPQEGSYFALLTPGEASVDTMISQPFEASNGDKVSGWAFFNAEDYLPFDDKGQVVITNRDSGTTVATPFEESVSSVGDGVNSGWMYWEYTFSELTGTGTFQIEARVHNTGDSDAMWLSRLGLDDVKTSASTGGPEPTETTTPPPETTTPPSDTTAPTVTNVTPAEGATEVATTSNVEATFSEAMDPASVTAPANFTLLKEGGTTAVDAKLSYNPDTKMATLDPTANLQENTSYTATIKGGSEGVKDIAGNAAANDEVWSFTTARIPPKVTNTTPIADATGVGRSTNVLATFSEALDPTTVTKYTFILGKGKLSASQLTSATRIASQTSVSYDPEALMAKLDPYGSTTTRLARCQWYTAKVTTDVKDLAGN